MKHLTYDELKASNEVKETLQNLLHNNDIHNFRIITNGKHEFTHDDIDTLKDILKIINEGKEG